MGVTPEGVVGTALQLGDEIGAREVSLSAVARRLGVAPPSLYAHVDGLRALRSGMAVAALAEMAEAAGVAIGGRSGADALAALAGSYRAYARDHPGRYEASTFPLDDLTAARSAGPRHADLAAAALREFGLTGDGLVHAIRLFGSVVAGFIALERAGAFSHSTPSAVDSWNAILLSLAGLFDGQRAAARSQTGAHDLDREDPR